MKSVLRFQGGTTSLEGYSHELGKADQTTIQDQPRFTHPLAFRIVELTRIGISIPQPIARAVALQSADLELEKAAQLITDQRAPLMDRLEVGEAMLEAWRMLRGRTGT